MIAAAVAWGLALAAAVRAREHRARDRVARGCGVPPEPAVPRRSSRPSPSRWRGGAGRAGPDDLAHAAAALAGSLRAGRTLAGALEDLAADRGTPPAVGRAARRVLAQRAVGVPLDRAVEAFAEGRVVSEARMFVTVLQVGRRTGVRLPVLLDELGSSMRDRAATERELRALTVQARMSGRILTLLPIGFFLFLALTGARETLPVLFSRTGSVLVGTGLLLQSAGALAVRRIVRVEV